MFLTDVPVKVVVVESAGTLAVDGELERAAFETSLENSVDNGFDDVDVAVITDSKGVTASAGGDGYSLVFTVGTEFCAVCVAVSVVLGRSDDTEFCKIVDERIAHGVDSSFNVTVVIGDAMFVVIGSDLYGFSVILTEEEPSGVKDT